MYDINRPSKKIIIELFRQYNVMGFYIKIIIVLNKKKV